MVDAVGTTHHVKLGDSYLLVHPNSYVKRAAPQFGARFTGGDPDYSQLNFWQHWGQQCWIGGLGQPVWEDDAMFDYAVGCDTSQHDLVVLARGLKEAGGNADLSGARRRRFHIFDDRLYCWDHLGSAPGKIFRYTELTATWAAWKSFDGLTIGAMANHKSDLYVGTSGNSLRKFDNGKWSSVRKPKGRTEVPGFMMSYRGFLFVGFGRRIYRLKANGKWSGAGTGSVFFDGAGIDRYTDACYHQGFMYIVSRNGHIVRTDGNQTFDLYQFDSHTTINSLASYDGKLFIFTTEWYDAEDVGELVVYQMSGAAVTEIGRYGRDGITTTAQGAIVVARRLFYGASSLLGVSAETGFGIVAYDAREDAHSLFACQRNTGAFPDSSGNGTDYIVDDVTYWGNRFFVHVRGHGVFYARYQHRDLAQAVADFDRTWTGSLAIGSDEGGVLVSSEFDAGTPGLNKIWRSIAVTVDLPTTAASVKVGYSIDGGRSWTEAGTITKDTSSVRYTREFFLEGVNSEQFKYKLILDSSDDAVTPFVRSVIVAFLPDPEPNWTWNFTAVLAEKVELLDGTVRTQDVAAMKAALETAWREQRLLYFQDVDGTEWVSGPRAGVLFQDISFSAPYMDDQTKEYTVQVSLLEAVEDYTPGPGV